MTAATRPRLASRNPQTLMGVIEAYADHAPDRPAEFELPRSVQIATRLADFDMEDRQRGLRIPGNCVAWPLSDLTRDLNLASPTAGGNLVASPRADTALTLGGASILERLGAQVFTLPIGNPPGHPAVDTAPVASWATGEGAAVGENEPQFALRPVAMCTVGCRFNLSRKFMKSVGLEGDRVVRAELMKALGREIDAAALGGTGLGGQPLGLAGTVGVYAQAGGTLGWAGIQNMVQQLGDVGVDDDASISFVGTPAVKELLAQRERAPGSGLVWAGGYIDGHRAIASRACPASTLIAGDFTRLTILVHGAITVIVDRFTYATQGAVRLVALADVAIVVYQPKAFAVASSVT